MAGSSTGDLPDATTLAALQEVEKSFGEAELDLARRQAQLFRPLYEKRDKLVASIPRFWATVLEECDDLAELINVEDQSLLSSLLALRVDRDFGDPREYRIHFVFAPNPFLEEESLSITKQFKLANPQDCAPDASLSSTTALISWKPQMDLTKQNLGRPSFFTFFQWQGTDSDVLLEGEEVAAILADVVYPDALKLWTEAVADDQEDDEASDDGSLDIAESDEGDQDAAALEQPQRKRAKV